MSMACHGHIDATRRNVLENPGANTNVTRLPMRCDDPHQATESADEHEHVPAQASTPGSGISDRWSETFPRTW
jgi:hypothetical protein